MYNDASKIQRKDRGNWVFLFSILSSFLMCSSVHSQSVVIYENPNFEGRSRSLAVGSYRFFTNTNGDFNDIVSSIKVPTGLAAIIFEHADEGGGYGISVDLLEDCPDLSKYNFNDKVSYVTVFSTNREGFVWVRNSIQNGQFVGGHWEHPRAGGNPVNTIAVVSPPLPPHPPTGPTTPNSTACEEIKARLLSLKDQEDIITEQLHDMGVKGKGSNLLQRLNQIRTQISSTQDSLDKCLPAPPASFKAPQNILEIQYKNPDPPSDPNWAKTPGGIIPKLRGTFPFPPSEKEWKQVLAPDDEYDNFTLVGASGWVTNREISGGDVPFTHPFGFDWEFGLALDPQYTSLLAPGNKNSKEGKDKDPIMMAGRLNIPVPDGGLFGVEWDEGLVPRSFQDQVNPGNRVAIFGRWILDTAHDFGGSLRTEIHPPLLMACASPERKSDGSPDSLITRAVFTSRPYLVGQTFTVDTKDIYNDGAKDDGHLFYHIANEVTKVNTFRSTLVEAHPKIKSHPFLGAHLAHFVIRPPSPQPAHRPEVVPKLRLAVSFHFTVRSGCAVQIVSTGTDAVDVFIALGAGVTPPPLPNRRDKRLSREKLSALDPDAGTGYLAGEAISAAIHYFFGQVGFIAGAIVEAILERGVETDEYDALKNVNILDSNHAVTNAWADSIPAGMGISKDDSQPFPVYGWVEVKWVKQEVLHQ